MKVADEKPPSDNVNGDARKRLHFEAGTMQCGVWTHPRLDEGKVVGVGIEEVGL